MQPEPLPLERVAAAIPEAVAAFTDVGGAEAAGLLEALLTQIAARAPPGQSCACALLLARNTCAHTQNFNHVVCIVISWLCWPSLRAVVGQDEAAQSSQQTDTPATVQSIEGGGLSVTLPPMAGKEARTVRTQYKPASSGIVKHAIYASTRTSGDAQTQYGGQCGRCKVSIM